MIKSVFSMSLVFSCQLVSRKPLENKYRNDELTD